MPTVTELVTRFDFQGSTAPLSQYNQSLGRGIGLLTAMTAALAASGAAVARWTTQVLGAHDATEQLSRSTGESVEWIQEMGFAASVNGGSVQGFQSSVESLSQKIGEAAQKGSEDFARLGISVRDMNGNVKSTEQVMSEIQVRFRQLNLSMSEQRSFAEALGIDSSMLQTLNLTSGEIARLRGEARDFGRLTEEQSDLAVDYNDSITRLRFGLDGLKNLIAIGLAPQFKVMTERFAEIIAENKDWIVNGIQATVEFIADLMAALGRLMPVLGVMAASFVALKVATLGWTGALALVFSPAILVAAAIAGVLLVIDDLIVAFQGGQSFIRDFFLEFFGWDIVPAMEAVVDAVMWMRSVVSQQIELVANIISTLVSTIRFPFEELFQWLADSFNNISSLVDKFGWVFGFGGREPEFTVTPAVENLLVPTTQREAPRIEQVNYIDVNTRDPERAARAVGDNLQRQMDDAQTQSRRGGM